jgi:hypothetical protein
MRLTTVLAAVNNNRNYYLFIPHQIFFWNKFNINFIAVFIGNQIPDELLPYSSNIILWNKNLNLNDVYIAQNIRIYYPSLLNLGDDEMVMITDMDMLPMNDTYYKSGLENFNKNDFIYYRNIDGNQIYMCYNAAHPSTWGKIFNIYNENDIENRINENYDIYYNGIPGSIGWYIDQEIMYNRLINYEGLKVLDRSINRLEVGGYHHHLNIGDTQFISKYDDAHFHRSYLENENLIYNARSQLN